MRAGRAERDAAGREAKAISPGSAHPGRQTMRSRPTASCLRWRGQDVDKELREEAMVDLSLAEFAVMNLVLGSVCALVLAVVLAGTDRVRQRRRRSDH